MPTESLSGQSARAALGIHSPAPLLLGVVVGQRFHNSACSAALEAVRLVVPPALSHVAHATHARGSRPRSDPRGGPPSTGPQGPPVGIEPASVYGFHDLTVHRGSAHNGTSVRRANPRTGGLGLARLLWLGRFAAAPRRRAHQQSDPWPPRPGLPPGYLHLLQIGSQRPPNEPSSRAQPDQPAPADPPHRVPDRM